MCLLCPVTDDSLVIYGLHTDDNIIRYVGLTSKGVRGRLISHRRDYGQDRNAHLPIYRWMKKVGIDNVHITQLDKSDSLEELQKKEIDLISYYRKNSELELLNISDGGYTGMLGKKHTEQAKENMRIAQARWDHSKSMLGKKHSDESKKKMSEARTGIPRPDVAKAMLGNTHSLGNRFSNPASKSSAHKRWHTNKGIYKPETCKFCVVDLQQTTK